MKMTKTILVLLSLCAAAFPLAAQDSGPPGQNGPPPDGGSGDRHAHRPPPLPALIRALDTNDDGILDAGEIANASAALKTLDRQGTGQLTIDEYLGPKPPNAPNDGHRRPLPAIVLALDTNHDGIIDAGEIANAPAALKTLDKNGDGILSPGEMGPPRPPRNRPDHAGPGPDSGAGPGGPPDGPPGQPPADQ